MRTERVTIGTSVLTPTFRYHPAIVAQAMATIALRSRGPAGGPRRRHRRVAQRGPARHRVAGPEGAVRPAQGSDRAHPAALDRGVRDVRRRVLQDPQRDDLRPPERPVEIWIAASGPAAARLAGRVADGFICTSGKGMELYSDTLLPAVAEGAEKAGRSADAIEKMIEVKVSYDYDRTPGAPGLRDLGGARPARRNEDGRRRPARDGAPRRRAADRAGRHAAGSSRTTRTSTSSRSGPTSSWASPTSCSTPPATNQSRFINAYARDILPRLRERFG